MKRALCQVLLASLVGAVLAILTAPASFAADATISWSGTLTIKDTYTHTYSKEPTDDDPSSCTGSVTTVLNATYRLSPKNSTVQADARVWGAYVPAEVTSQSGSTSGTVDCTWNQSRSSEYIVNGPLQFTDAEPLSLLFEYDREVDRLAFVHGGGPATYIEGPPVTHNFTNGNEKGTNTTYWYPPFRASGPRLEFEPAFGQPLSDYRIPFPNSTANFGESRLDVTHENPLIYTANGGDGASASNGLSIGNYSNFSTISAPIGGGDIALHEEITTDLHGVVTNAAPPEADMPVMASLGDSYSSGEGAYDYEPGTDVAGANHCHRSARAYGRTGFAAMRTGQPSDLQEEYSFACSGAVTAHVDWAKFCGSGCDAGRWEPSQLEQLRKLEELPGKRVELVTVGIGGNDAGFGKVIKECLSPHKGNCVATFDPRIGRMPAGASIHDVAASVSRLLDEIEQIAPAARIVLVGYPVFIGRTYEECPKLLANGIGADEAEWIRGQILEMNRALEAVATARAADGARFLSLDEVYATSVLCNGGTPDSQLVHGLVLRGGAADGASAADGCSVYETIVEARGRALSVCNESFHPKAMGHWHTGAALAACVKDDACGSASREVVRGSAALDGVGVSAPDEPNCGPSGYVCVRPTHPVPVRATGFRPGTQVQVDLHSRSVRLGEATVGADGSVELTVTVPAGAVVPGPHKIVVTGPGDSTIIRAATLDVTVSCDSGFSDVPPEHPVCADITWVSSGGVTTGYSDGTYQPTVGLTRAQMASFLWRLAGRPPAPPNAPSFTDVGTDNPHEPAVRWLAARAITSGYSDGTFRPGQGLTRQQMAAFLHRFAGQPAPDPNAPTFTDVPADSLFGTAISWLAGEGITTGKGDGTFDPGGQLTRQQMATFLHRFGEPRGLPE